VSPDGNAAGGGTVGTAVGIGGTAVSVGAGVCEAFGIGDRDVSSPGGALAQPTTIIRRTSNRQAFTD
jgi:hypothetical protein